MTPETLTASYVLATRSASLSAVLNRRPRSVPAIAGAARARSTRQRSGRNLRRDRPLDAVAKWRSPTDRRDPTAQLTAQDTERVPELVPLRNGRMAASPFGYFAGAPGVMAADLVRTATSGLSVQLCGDAQLCNFGAVAAPAGELVFDVRDFDETVPGPWEYDLRRLAASTILIAREWNLSDDSAREVVAGLAQEYRKRIRELAGMRMVQLWECAVPGNGLSGSGAGSGPRSAARSAPRRAPHSVPGRIADHARQPSPAAQDEARGAYLRYLHSLPEERQFLVRRFALDDVKEDTGGIARVGIRRFVLTLHGNDRHDIVEVQLRQATHSVLEQSRPSRLGHDARRVALGQRLIQAMPDPFLGWTIGARGRTYCVRLAPDARTSFAPTARNPEWLASWTARCAWALARAHARTCDAVLLAAYLGTDGALEDGLAGFALKYADLIERDHAALRRAVVAHRVPVAD